MDRQRFVICVDNSDYPASLELRKAYQVVADTTEDLAGHVRIIDESGDDYLYPETLFVDASLSEADESAVANAS